MINKQNLAKQLFYFLKMQFVLKYLLNPGCKHFSSARDFVEASTPHLTGLPHCMTGKSNYFDAKESLAIRFVVFIKVSHHPTNLHKKASRCFFHLVKLAKMQSKAGETKHICCKGPLSMNDKLSADRNEHANKFAKFTVPIYSSSILTRFKPS